MHDATISFARKHLTRAIVEGRTIVEVGSLDVDGGCWQYRSHAMQTGALKYIGLDMRAGANVDLVANVEDMVSVLGEGSVDGVLTVSTLEHVKRWRDAVMAMKRVLRKGGWLLVGVPGPGFPLHEYPEDYWRFTVADARRMFADFQIDTLEEDPQVGGFLMMATKPKRWVRLALDDITVATAG